MSLCVRCVRCADVAWCTQGSHARACAVRGARPRLTSAAAPSGLRANGAPLLLHSSSYCAAVLCVGCLRRLAAKPQLERRSCCTGSADCHLGASRSEWLRHPTRCGSVRAYT
jgi:hypothetical protein